MSKKTLGAGLVLLVVLVGGFLVFSKKSVTSTPQAPVITEKTVEPKKETLDDLIANVQEIKLPEVNILTWQTYKNTDYGFEMKIPKDWYVENPNENFFCLKSKTRKFAFEGEKDVCGISISKNYSSEDEYVSSIKTFQLRGVELKLGKVTFAGGMGLYTEGFPGTGLTYKNTDILWNIQIAAAEGTFIKNSVHDIFPGIIQTFHFVN